MKKLFKDIRQYLEVYIFNTTNSETYSKRLQKEKTRNLKQFPFLSEIITQCNLEPTLVRFDGKISDRMLNLPCYRQYSEVNVSYFIVSQNGTVTKLQEAEPFTITLPLQKSESPTIAEQAASIKDAKYLVEHGCRENDRPGFIVIYKI